MLQIKNLYFDYGGASVLEDVSFQVRDGEMCGLFGPNGSGKTTLFKCCLRFFKTRQGSVLMGGVDIRKLTFRELARRAAYVPQDHKPPFPYLVREVVLMGRTPHLKRVAFGIGNRDKAKAMDALRLLGIAHLADRPYSRLSGGQRQMVLIARAIAQETGLIFLDEPTSALDFSNQIKIWRTLQDVARRGVGIVACSHDPNHVAWFCDKVVVLKEKRILDCGPPSQVITEAVLNEIYSNICTVGSLNGVRIVLPKHVRPDGKEGGRATQTGKQMEGRFA